MLTAERKQKVLICVSGGGTNLQAVMDAMEAGTITNAEIAAVISNNQNAYALKRAEAKGIPALCVSPGAYPDREAFHAGLLEEINRFSPDLIVLAGFLVAIPASLIAAYEGRIINIHPSLIPAFCGVGYYGLRVHEAALARGVKITGATVHFVDNGMDTGPILLQKAVEIQPGDDAKTLQRRVMEEAEWKILPEAINLIVNGRVTLEDGKAVIR